MQWSCSLNIGCCWSLLRLSIDVCAGFSGRCCRLVFTEGDLLEALEYLTPVEVEARV